MHGSETRLGIAQQFIYFRLQKRAARVIVNADTRANSVGLFRELYWLTFFHEAKINKCALIHKRLNGDCPQYMTEFVGTLCGEIKTTSRC